VFDNDAETGEAFVLQEVPVARDEASAREAAECCPSQAIVVHDE
jgi:ferredoxin